MNTTKNVVCSMYADNKPKDSAFSYFAFIKYTGGSNLFDSIIIIVYIKLFVKAMFLFCTNKKLRVLS